MNPKIKNVLLKCAVILGAVLLCMILYLQSYQCFLQFSRTDYQYRWYCARVVPFTSIRLSSFTHHEFTGDGIHHDPYRPPNLQYLVDEGYLKVTNGFGTKWIFATMPAPGKGGQADLQTLNRYFHDDESIIEWTKKHPEEAKRFWCLIQVQFEKNHEYHAQSLLIEAHDFIHFDRDITPLLDNYDYICDADAQPDRNYQD